jgi:hypothetical protein
MSQCGRHAVVFETARGIQAFVLQEQAASIHAGKAANGIGSLQYGLPLADGNNRRDRCER